MRTARRNAGGFVLVATLWVLAALAVLAAWIDGVVATDIERAVMAKRALQSELDHRNTEATLIYLFTTGRMNHRGLILEEEQRFSGSLSDDDSLPDPGDGEVRVGGEVYAGLGGTRFSVQDESGLVSVNAPNFALFAVLLKHVGVDAADIEWIVARVEDYIDSDSDLTLNGAEHHDYRQQGKPPPLNWIMASPLELGKVLGVDALITPAQWRRLRPLLTMQPALGYNFNTMSPEILAAVLGLDERAVQGVLEEREKESLSRLTRIAMLSGKHLDIDELEMRVFPSRFMRVSIWPEGGASRTLVGVALSPFGDTAPWRKDYRYSEPITTADTTADDSRTPREPPLEVATALFQ